ncbi:unnamed protein product [Arabidopsis halleri]
MLFIKILIIQKKIRSVMFQNSVRLHGSMPNLGFYFSLSFFFKWGKDKKVGRNIFISKKKFQSTIRKRCLKFKQLWPLFFLSRLTLLSLIHFFLFKLLVCFNNN